MAKEKIEVKKEDLPKIRNLDMVQIINRGGKGPHKNQKKEESKKVCRQKVSENDE